MAKQQQKGLKRLVAAFRYSKGGVSAAWKNEAAFRQEVCGFMLAIPIACIVASSVFQFCILVASLLFVIVVELLNSGIEAVVDRISMEHHELSGVAKDMGSAAVLLSIVICLLVWGGMIWNNFF